MSETIEISLETTTWKNTINGNIDYLGTPYGTKISINENNETVAYEGNEEEADTNNETIVDDNYLLVKISKKDLENTLTKLNNFKKKFKKDFPNVNIDYIKYSNDDSEEDNRPLDINSLVYAIESIWTTFPSKKRNNMKKEKYVNDAYTFYNFLYEYEIEENGISNETRRFINPLLFPKIFQLVFVNHKIPLCRKEINFLSSGNYNKKVSLHNKDFDNGNPKSLRLFIYRNENQIKGKVDNKSKKINKIIKNVKTIKKRMSEKTS